ncbi:glycosyltransferase family 4 protein [Actinotalea sp. K2]|nr:glycosyltransferase family 4 protein [Actinotalea sp. K2]
MIEREESRFVSTHPTVSVDSLERYLLTGLECRLVARVAEPTSDRAVGDLAHPRLTVIPLYGDDKKLSAVRRVLATVAQLIRVPISRGDIVVVRLPEFIGVLLWFRAKLARAVVVSNVVADVTAVREHFGRAAPAGTWLLRRAVRWMVARSSATAYVTRRTLQALYPPRSTVPSISASNVRLGPESFTHAARTYDHVGPDSTVRLVAVGSQESLAKGHDFLIRSLMPLKGTGLSVTLDLVGEGSCQAQLVALAQQLGVEDRVRFLGFVSDRTSLNATLDAADFFVMPSRTEGLPRAMVEAMARGLCCMGSAVGGIPELAPPQALFRVDDVESFRQVLMRLVSDPSMAGRIAAQQWRDALDISNSAKPDRFAQFLTTLGRRDGA